MRKFLLIISCFCLASVLFSADPLAAFRKRAEKIRYGSPEDFAFGDELCKEFARIGAGRKNVVSHPLFIAQPVPHRLGHLSFTNTIWNDRQLFCDRRLWESAASDFQYSSVLKNFQDMRDAGYDGAALWIYPGFDRAWVYYLKAANALGDFKLMPGATPVHAQYSKFEKPLAEAMCNHPSMMRLNGAPLIRSYTTDIPSNFPKVKAFLEDAIASTGRDVMYMTELFLVRGVKERFPKGDKFVDPISFYWRYRKVSGKSLLIEYDYLVDYLKLPGSGGLCYGPYMTDQALKFPEEFYEKITLPLFKAVLARPEFNGKKLFTLNFKCGYTHSAGSQTMSRDGTKTLRKNLELFLKHKPDVLIGSEWDELNEDTCLGPTVVRPMSGPRITRYYSAVSRGKKLSPLPGDDLSVPNLIISQRRELPLGSEFELEILNVPDSEKNNSYTVDIDIFDHKGKKVHSAKNLSFSSGKMEDHTIRLNTAKLTECRTLSVNLQIKSSDGIRNISSGLPFTVLRPAVCDNHTWYCTPIRNLMQPENADVSFKPFGREVSVNANLSFKEPLNSVEILESTYTVAAFDANDEFATADGSNQLYCLTTVNVKNKKGEVNLSINVPSAIAFSIPVDPRKTAERRKFPAAVTVDHNINRQYFAVPVKNIKSAVLSVKGCEIDCKIPLVSLKSGDVVSRTADSGAAVALQVSPVPMRMSLPLKDGNVKWKIKLPVTLPEVAMVVRAVSQNGKVWYSDGFIPEKHENKNGKKLLLAGHNEYRKWQRFYLPANRVPEISYQFDPANGSTLRCDAGQEYFAQLGANAQLASRSNGTRTEKNSGISKALRNGLTRDSARPTPQWRKENGKNHLYFDGKSGNFLMLPRTAVPQYSGFHITMEIRPHSFSKRQIVWSQYNSYQTGLELFIANGVCGLSSVQRRPHDLRSPYLNHHQLRNKQKLMLNKWNKVEIIYDGQKITLGVNGKYTSVNADGVARWMSVSAFGGWDDKMFHGDLRSLTITPALPENKK